MNLFTVNEPCPICGACDYLGERHKPTCALAPARGLSWWRTIWALLRARWSR